MVSMRVQLLEVEACLRSGYGTKHVVRPTADPGLFTHRAVGQRRVAVSAFESASIRIRHDVEANSARRWGGTRALNRAVSPL